MKYNPILVKGEILGYDIRNDAGMSIGRSHDNPSPFEGCEPVTIKDAEANARLWAASDTMIEAIDQIMISLNNSSCGWNMDSEIERAYQLCKIAFKKAKGL